MKISDKVLFILNNLWYFIWTYPIRLYRVPKLILTILWDILSLRITSTKLLEQLFSFILLLGDLVGVPEIYDSAALISKKTTRKIDQSESELALKYLPSSFPIQMIKIDNQASILAKKGYFAYVSFFTINLFGNLRKDTFVHELIHVWQYTRFGSAYIAKALFAQRSKEGYNYGGIEGLMDAYTKNKHFLDFNFEQQGDILADYYRTHTLKDQLIPSVYAHRINIYEHFINDMKSINIYRL